MWPELLLAMALGSGASVEPVTYLALGDSYTIGESVPEAGRWPVQLAAALREQGLPLEAPRIIAKTGWTTDELSSAISEAQPLPTFDFVTLLVGVNNQYRGRSVEDYRGEFAGVLDRAIGFSKRGAAGVMVLSIPDWGATPFGTGSGRDTAQIARELDAYNATAAELCAARGVAFVDITPASRAPDAGVAEDGLHPSAEQYAEWTQLALPVAKNLLTP